MVVGDGFIPIKGKSTTLLTTSQKGEVISDDSLTEIEEVISSVNLHNQNLQEVLSALAFDYDAFGNCFAEIVRGRVGNQPFSYIYHVPVYYIGIRKAAQDQIIKSVGIYDNWEEVPLTTDGSLYASEGFRKILRENKIKQSMSRRGNCYDNAITESFFHTLKTELIKQNKYKNRLEARLSLFEYIEIFYNRKRIHSSLGYLSPVEYEKFT